MSQESPFWNAYNQGQDGPGQDLEPRKEDASGEIVAADLDEFGHADDAILEAPVAPKQAGGTDKRRLALLIGAPVALLLIILMMSGGHKQTAANPTPVPQTTIAPEVVTTPDNPTVAPPLNPAQQFADAQHHGSRGVLEVKKLSFALINSHFAGQSPTGEQVGSYLASQFQATPERFQVSLVATGEYLINYTAPGALNPGIWSFKLQ
jgi:hypothetical protein